LFARAVVLNQKEPQELVVVEKKEKKFVNLAITYTKKIKSVIVVAICSSLLTNL